MSSPTSDLARPSMASWLTSTILAILLGVVGANGVFSRDQLIEVKKDRDNQAAMLRKTVQDLYTAQEACPSGVDQ